MSNANKDALDLANKLHGRDISVPPYNATSYYDDVTRHPYFDALIVLRHYIKVASDAYWGQVVGAKNVDLFMMTPSVSSPMGPGSDSEAIAIKFGALDTYLVDSSQFGFEPLLFQNLDKVYCYLPSMRGEDPDNRHLNQFFHCEAEIVGALEDLKPLIEGYIKALAEISIALLPLVRLLSKDPRKTEQALRDVLQASSFNRASFEDAWSSLQNTEQTKVYTKSTPYGRGIDSGGEQHIALKNSSTIPMWIYGFDRDTVAFYQKPDPANRDKTINADLIFPPLVPGGFGGEVVGSGQRQDDPKEMEESLARQGISAEAYEWYVDLRKSPHYRTTSGFGLGIERFIAWMLGYESIRDVILYPRLKNVHTLP